VHKRIISAVKRVEFVSDRLSYPRALGSLYVASYDSQGSGGGILTRLHRECSVFSVYFVIFFTFLDSRRENIKFWTEW
jgi:hypothetical protein